MTAGRRLLLVSSPCRGEARALQAVPDAAARLYATLVDPERGQCTPVLLNGVELGGPLDDPDVDAAQAALQQAVQQCSDGEDLLVLAWIGHGYSEKGRDDFYLMPRGAQAERPTTTGLDLVNWLRRTITDWGPTLPGLILLLDACYAGTAIRSAAKTLVTELAQTIAVEVLTSTTSEREAYNARFTDALARLIHEGLPAHGGEHLTASDLKPLLLRATQQHPQSLGFDLRDDGPPLWIAKNIGRRRMARAARLAALAEGAADAGRFDRAMRLAVIACRETGEGCVHPDAQSALHRACDGNRLAGQFGPAHRVLFDRDGARLVSLHENMAQLCNTAGVACGAAMPHGERVRDAAFSADGAQLVTCTAAHVHTWDAGTGTATGAPVPIKGQYGSTLQHVTVLDGGGIRCVLADWDGRLPVVVDIGPSLHWYPLRGQGHLFPHGDRVQAAAATRDGRLVATGGLDGSVVVWKRHGDAFETARAPIDHGGWISSLAFSADGQRLLVASMHGVAAIWDTEPNPFASMSGPEKPALLPHADRIDEKLDRLRGVYQASFSPDGHEAVTASADGTARLWRTRGAFAQAGVAIVHDTAVDSAGFVPPQAERVVTTSGHVARIWQRRLPRRRWKIAGDIIGRPVAAFSPDGRQTLVQRDVCSVAVCADGTGEPMFPPLEHADAVLWAEFSRDGRQLVTASGALAQRWDAQTGAPIDQPLPHTAFWPSPDAPAPTLYRAHFSPDGSLLATVDLSGTVCLWDLATRAQRVLAEPAFGEMDALFSPDGTRLLLLGGPAQLWELAPSGACILLEHMAATPADGAARVYCAAFSGNGRHVVTGATNGALRLWDAQTGLALGRPMAHGAMRCEAVEFSPDGMRFVSASCDGTARLWRVPACKPLGAPMVHDGAVIAARFSRDGRRVVTASADGSAGLWHGSTGARLAQPIQHDDEVERVGFHPVHDSVLTATRRCVAVWEAPFSLIESAAELVQAACAALPEAARRIDAGDIALAGEFIPQEAQGQDILLWRPAEL